MFFYNIRHTVKKITILIVICNKFRMGFLSYVRKYIIIAILVNMRW
jgi:hypothetical protein